MSEGAVQAVIDAHLHVWDRDRGGLDWLGTPRWRVIRRDFDWDDFVAGSSASGVVGGVLVHATMLDAESDRLLDLAADRADVLGVVGWVDLSDLRRLGPRLDEMVARGPLRGARLLCGWSGQREVLLDRRIVAAAEQLRARGLILEVQPETPADIRAVGELVRAVDGLRTVLSHLGRPRFDDRDAYVGWERALGDLAAVETVSVKLSGWSTLVGVTEAPPEALDRAVRSVLDQYGARRVIFGGNWPVSLTGGSYADMVRRTIALLADLDDVARDAILCGNAAGLFGDGRQPAPGIPASR